MKFEGLPEKRILPINEPKEISERKFGDMTRILKGDSKYVDTDKKPTVIDFPDLPPSSGEKDFLKWIEKEIGISPSVILNRKNPEHKEEYKNLNHAYIQGKNFLRDTLKYSEEELSVGPDGLFSKEDIFDLLKGTVAVKGIKGLSRSVAYCRIVKATLVAYETLKHDADSLKEIMEKFENKIISPISENKNPDAPFVLIREGDNVKYVYVQGKSGIQAEISSRAKDIQKAMLRFINRPDSSAESALKDGIALSIVVDKGQVVDLLPVLVKWLSKKMGVRHFEIENKSFFSQKQKNRVEEILLEFLSRNNFDFKEGVSNPTSMGDFSALVIEGVLENAITNKKVSEHVKQFEIQIISKDNVNEKGKNNHNVYDVVKFVNARTRLDGGCPESVFREFVREASYKSGIEEEDIIDFLTQKENSPIDKIRKNNKNIYVAHSVYKRWNGFGWVDGELFSEIDAIHNKK
jgi:frataxin-like iron-binding protein CyaY